MCSKAVRVVFMLFLCLLFSSCSISKGIPELMQAPRLSEEQEAVNKALERSLGTGNYTLKYPRSGAYRSAFVFYDIDQDNEEEAIAFYQLGGTGRGTSINILDKQDGRWHSIYDRPGIERGGEADYEIDYVQFENIESTDYKNIIIGWQLSNPTGKQLSIYTYEVDALDAEKKLDRRYSQNYSDLLIRDMDNDGLMDIALLSKKGSNPYKLLLVTSDNGSIDVLDNISLGDNVDSIQNIILGRLGDTRQALFIDVGLRYSEKYATEIVAIESNVLIKLINLSEIDTMLLDDSDMAEEEKTEESSLSADQTSPPDAKTQRLKNFKATLRNEKILSGDMNGDGIIEIPSSKPMLGYEEMAANAEDIEGKIQYLTTYSVYQNGVMVPSFHACVNLQGKYLVKIPDRWLGKVTLYSENDLTQWQFIKYTGSLSDLSIELLRIKNISKNDYQDRLEVNPILLSPQDNSLYQIYGYLQPTEEEELAISERELRSMFVLF